MGRVRRRGDEVDQFVYTDPRRSVQEERIAEREYDELGRVRRERIGVRTRTTFRSPHQLERGEPEGWLRRLWSYFVDLVTATVFLVLFLISIAVGYELGELTGIGVTILGAALLITLSAHRE